MRTGEFCDCVCECVSDDCPVHVRTRACDAREVRRGARGRGDTAPFLPPVLNVKWWSGSLLMMGVGVRVPVRTATYVRPEWGQDVASTVLMLVKTIWYFAFDSPPLQQPPAITPSCGATLGC